MRVPRKVSPHDPAGPGLRLARRCGQLALDVLEAADALDALQRADAGEVATED